MKLAVFSDIHGNLYALEAIIDAIKKEGVDEIISLGDAVSIGPRPGECLDLIQETGITAVLGNHEVECLTGWHKDRDQDYSSFFKWQRKILSERHFDFMRSQEASILRNGVRFQHFIIDETIRGGYPGYCYVKEFGDNAKSLTDIVEKMDERNIVIGHEHHAITKVYGDKNVFCIGSSGCVAGDSTFYMIFNISDDGKVFSMEKRPVKYDREKLLQDLAKIDYPNKRFFEKTFFGMK